jgi:hypothetical protein
VVTVVLWLPPLIQQVGGHPGNLGEVARFFLHPQYTSMQAANVAAGPPAGWTAAYGVMGEQLTPPGPWLAGNDVNGFGFAALAEAWPAVLSLIAAVGAGVVAWRRGAGEAARLAVVAVVMVLLGLIATSRITGILAPYLVRWWWVVALLLWLAIGWCGAQALGVVSPPRAADTDDPSRRLDDDGPTHDRRRPLVAAAGVVAAGGAVALVAATVIAALPAPLPFATKSDAISHLALSTARAAGRNGPFLLRWQDPESLAGVGSGMFTALRQEGLDVVAPPALATGVGSWRTAPPAHFHAVITGVGVPDPTTTSQPPPPPPGSRLVAGYDPLSPQQRQEAIVLQRSIRAAMGPHAPQGPLVVSAFSSDQALLVAGGASAGDVARLASLQARGSPYVVYLTPGQG